MSSREVHDLIISSYARLCSEEPAMVMGRDLRGHLPLAAGLDPGKGSLPSFENGSHQQVSQHAAQAYQRQRKASDSSCPARLICCLKQIKFCLALLPQMMPHSPEAPPAMVMLTLVSCRIGCMHEAWQALKRDLTQLLVSTLPPRDCLLSCCFSLPYRAGLCCPVQQVMGVHVHPRDWR